MFVFLLTGILWFSSSFGVATALAPGNGALRTRNAPGMTDGDTINTIGRALHKATLQSRNTVYSMNNTSLAKSWSGATLFIFGESYTTDGSTSLDQTAAIEIICSTCYVNGSVTGDLTLSGGFNFTEAVDNVKDDIVNITDTAINELETYVKTVAEDAVEDIANLDLDAIPGWPTLDLDFNLDDVAALPEAHVHFEFDNLELYLDLDIRLSAGATYTLNIFSSETPAGFQVPGLTVGAVFSVDLILIADAEIDIGSGIHIKLEEGLSFDLEMFNSNVSSISVPGGVYEFLPVTIAGEGSIQAILSLKASLGVDVSSSSLEDVFTFSSGIEADVFAYVADFLLQVNGTTAADDGDCELAAVAEYTMAVGAAAGATVAVDTYSWGPSPNTTVPVWYTTLASVCATSKTSSVTSTTSAMITARAELNARDDVSTAAVSSIESYTIVNCLSSGLINCPASLQNTTSYKRTVTSEVAVQSGASTTFPANTFASVTSAIPFGTNVRSLLATSGSPTSYTPAISTSTTSATGGGSSILDGTTNGTSNRLIIGLSVGLGVPFLLALILGLGFYIVKRKKYALVPPQAEATTQYSPSMSYDSPGTPGTKKDATRIFTTET
ncbi:hypothetical protein N7513_011077 [Penicillium frequentans]|nr:hypothetical protein N7513_011077 [Penicillium glabrum]